jgi:putative membrane protein
VNIRIRALLIATTALLGTLTILPAGAVSLDATGPSQPLPEGAPNVAAPLAIETWSAGSAALVPMMAVETPARETPAVDAPANTLTGSVGKPLDDLAFVRQATESGRKEMAAARDALPQLRNPELRRLAEMLANDHGAANAKLAQLAESKGWPVPAAAPDAPPPGDARGDFDAQWTADMLAGHERSMALYRAEAKSGEDPDLRQFAHDTLPTIEHHLAALRNLQK